MARAGRIGDRAQVVADAHGCPGCPHECVGQAVRGSPDVNINARPALRVGDVGIHSSCCGPNVWKASRGSSTVFINGKPAHRLGDANHHCGGIGQLVDGSSNVFVGG